MSDCEKELRNYYITKVKMHTFGGQKLFNRFDSTRTTRFKSFEKTTQPHALEPFSFGCIPELIFIYLLFFSIVIFAPIIAMGKPMEWNRTCRDRGFTGMDYRFFLLQKYGFLLKRRAKTVEEQFWQD